MTIAFATGHRGLHAHGVGAIVAKAFANQTVAGNTIIGWAWAYGSATNVISTIVDTQSNTYIKKGPFRAVCAGIDVAVYGIYVDNIAGDPVTPETVTVTWDSAPQGSNIALWEVSGLDSAGSFVDDASATGTGTAMASGALVGVSGTNAIISLVAGYNPGGGFTASGTLVKDLEPDDYIYDAFGSVIDTTTNPAWTNASCDWICTGMAFKAAAAGGITGPLVGFKHLGGGGALIGGRLVN